MEAIYSKLDDLLEGQPVDEVIRVLAYALADSVAFATEYQFSEENNAAMQAMASSAYKHACESNSVTVQ